ARSQWTSSLPVAPRMSETIASPRSSSRPCASTRAPPAASRSASARPSPSVVPVIRIVCSWTGRTSPDDDYSWAPMRLLITGAAGMPGQVLPAAATAAGIETVALSRADLDITDGGAVDEAVSRVRPDVVVNCAAWTDVDRAESEEADALAANGAGAGNVARA